MSFLDSLNARQREAVETVQGPLLVLAGAGSGKTRVITSRIIYLIEHSNVRAEQILAVTFTNKAAQEMKSRVEAVLARERRHASPLIATFHSLCVRILRRSIERMDSGYTRNFTIYDRDDQERLVRLIMRELHLSDDKSLTGRQALAAISGAKSRAMSPDAYASQGDYASERTERITKIYRVYEQRLKQANALDFDDLLLKAVELLRRVTEVRTYYHDRYRHLMIDEFQDTNGIQYELARLIAVGAPDISRIAASDDAFWKDRSLCVVGDVDQSIYSWRGSDFNIILGFQSDFAGTKMITLEQNYRSTQTILEAANRVIEQNARRLPKALVATEELGEGAKIGYYQSYDGEGEASFVADRIEGHLRESPAIRCAVLYRTNAQSRLFEEALRRRSLAYNIVGGFSFYERAEVKDVISYLKLAMNPRDDIALARVINTPPRGIGKATLEIIESKMAELDLSMWETIGVAIENRALGPRATTALEGFRKTVTALEERVKSGESLSEIVKAATLDTGYVRALEDEGTQEAEGRLLNIEELVTAAVEAEEQGETLRDFIDHAALASDTDQYKEDARVTLMTVHSAKGLEFPVVCIAGLEEGLFPHSRAAESEEDLEEERRLCYVAITRAQKHLYLTHSMRRRVFGEEMPCDPSRFLNEVPIDLINDMSRGPSWLGFVARPENEHNRHAISALRGSTASPVKKTSTYQGKTYNSVESVNEFFKRKTAEVEGDRFKASKGRSERARPASEAANAGSGDLRAGARVRHTKYGVGVVLRTEGSGEDAKLTVSFPGYGHKKFVAKYAALERA
jgi:DNA helicase-2/ATP-dependent DNA helicase PcrA